MWYIFPQLVGLGSSATAKYYAIANLEEAQLLSADLTGADLSDAVLVKADLSDARLEGAVLDRARWVDRRRCAAGSLGACR